MNTASKSNIQKRIRIQVKHQSRELLFAWHWGRGREKYYESHRQMESRPSMTLNDLDNRSIHLSYFLFFNPLSFILSVIICKRISCRPLPNAISCAWKQLQEKIPCYGEFTQRSDPWAGLIASCGSFYPMVHNPAAAGPKRCAYFLEVMTQVERNPTAWR